MRRSKMMEFGVGLFMLAGVIGVIFLGLRVSGLGTGVAGDTLTLHANFANIGGLKVRSKVTLAGVEVGQVTAIELDPEWFDARVTFTVDDKLKGELPRDSTAAILTAGLLGEQYIGLSMGGAPEMLEDGDTIRDTQQALVLEELIQQFVSNMVKE